MISIGNKGIFAIQSEITTVSGDWVLGRFRFILHGVTCGNWNDEADLRSCCSSLRQFAETLGNRNELGLMEASAQEVVQRLVTPVIVIDEYSDSPEVYDRTFSRFHIAHIGASAFDRVIMVLVEDNVRQRCLWEEGGVLHDDFFPKGLMQQTALMFCEQLTNEAIASGANRQFPFLK